MKQTSAGERIQRLLSEQLVGVLCTAADRQPHGFPMVFIVARDLRSIAFATYRNTRKYEILTKNPLVAFVVDNRASLGDFEPASAALVAATGAVAEVGDHAEVRRLRLAFAGRYPKLRAFFHSPRTTFFKLAVNRYSVVIGVDETTELHMSDLSALG